MVPIQVVKTNGAVAHVAVAGELNLATGDVVLRKLSSLVDRGYIHLVVDASAVSFCDSSGLGALLRARARASSAAGGLTVRAASPQLRRVLSVAGLDKLLGSRPGRQSQAPSIGDAGFFPDGEVSQPGQ
jgi:anti-anti-sigma factor